MAFWFQLFLWVVSFVLSDYFREKLPSQTPSGVGDFDIPTATEGRVVPIIPGGTARINAPNCIWYGDFAAIERTVTTGIIFQEEETIGFTYELALQYALCKNEVAGMTGIWIGDDRVFDYVADAGGVPQTVVDVDRDDLFGGTDNGGGFVGRVRLFTGSNTQGVSTFLDSRIDPLPAYTGTCYAMITDLTETVGANIGETNQLRYIRIELQTFDTIANGGLGDRLLLGNDHHFIGQDANPISVAYELYLNVRWGRGFPASDVSLTSFQAAAETCFTEGIGYTQVIDELTSTGEIQDTLEQHIDGYIGPNPITGQIEVTLARFDYVLANEFQAGESNIVAVKKWSKGDWSETVNRIRLRYSDRDKDWNESHAIELAAGNRIIQGVTVTKELRFQGVHNADVASKIAARTRRGLTKPQASGTIELDRTAYLLRPGGVFSFTSEKVNEDNLPVRVTKVSIGNVQKNTIIVEVLQDLFDIDTQTVAPPPATDFVPPIQVVIPFDVADQAATEPPFVLMRLNPLPNLVPRVATFARRAPGNTPTEYEVIRRTGNPPSGAFTSTDFVTGGFMQVGTLRDNELGWATGNGGKSVQIDPIGAASLDGLIAAYSPTNLNAAGIAVISPGIPALEEWIAFEEIVDDLGGIRLEKVWRGCMDTNQKAHTIGERIWFIWTGGLGMGEETYAPAVGVEMKFLPRSPTDAVLEAAATALPVVDIRGPETSGRQSKPLHPLTLTMNLNELPQAADEIDFDRLITSGPNATLPGAQCVPQLRAFNTQGIIASVMGLAFDGTGFNPDDVVGQVLETEIWLHNLDTDPSANRTNAVVHNPLQAQLTANDQFELLKSDILAAGVEGFQFTARIDLETRHSPAGQFPNQISYESMQFDFIAIGVFTVLPADVILQSHFDGVDAATEADEVGPFNPFIQFNGAAEIDTAESVFGGASLLLDGIDSFVRLALPPRWDIATEWTVELRARFTADPGGTVELVSQMDGERNSWTINYVGGADNFQFGHSTTGANGPFFTAMHSGTFVPNAGQQYALAFCKEVDGTIHCFVDGVQVGSTVSITVSWFRSSNDVLLGARNFAGSLNAFFDGHFDEFRMTPKCLYRANYTIDTVAFKDSRRNYPLLAHFDAADGAVAYTDESLYQNVLLFGAATTQIDTGQSMFGGSSLEMTGVDGTGPLGTGDGILLPYQDGQNLGRDTWVMELFMRFRTLPDGDGSMLLSKYNRGGSNVDWYWWVNTDLSITFSHTPTGNVAQQNFDTSPTQTMVIDTWYHFAAQRRGNDLEMYFNGNRVLLEVDAFLDGVGYVGPLNQLDDSTARLSIGSAHNVSVATRYRANDGWIDEPRFVHGVLPYNGSTYPVPTAANPDARRVLTEATQDPLMLLSGWENVNGFATDNIMQTEDLGGARIVFADGANIDTGVFKFGSSSLDLDGVSDQAQLHFSETRHLLRASDFTIDCWAEHDLQPHDDANGGHCLMSKWLDSNNTREWAFYLDDAGSTTDLVFAWSIDGTAIQTAFVAAVTIVPNQFHHWQVVRQGATLFLFQDGVLQTLDGASDSISGDTIFSAANEIWIGRMNNGATDREMDGHIDETRITRQAENTATFTPETAPYPRPTLPFF